jgi:outer membrane protein OmpA-like peptidoglycan-associated protein
MWRGVAYAACLGLWAVPASALVLDLPGAARVVDTRTEPVGSHAFATGPYRDGALPTLATEGAFSQSAFHLSDAALTTLQILTPLRDQLTGDGFQVIYECDTAACGGYDFRYAMDVLPEPVMHVNLGDFRYVTLRREAEGGPEVLGVLVSRSMQRGFIQITHVAPADADALVSTTTSTKTPDLDNLPVTAGDLHERLETTGHVVLSDVEFAPGSSELSSEDTATLIELATYLRNNPDRRVTLVGHTDAVGTLDGNVALSKRRAESVMAYLASGLGVPADQMQADGVGYLSPLSTNLTENGRTENRRVEVILTSTQ